MKYPSKQFGFSLVEALVAITILLLVIVGPMTIISTTANSTSFASDQVVAFFLAQEGLELAQKVRDDLILDAYLPSADPAFCQDAWNGFTYDGCTGALCPQVPPSCGPDYRYCHNPNNGCALSLQEIGGAAVVTSSACGTGSDACRLYYDGSDFGGSPRLRYTYTSTNNEETPYQRRIKFETLNDESVRVTSAVEWFPGNTSRSQTIEVETVLFDLYGN